MGRRSVWGFTGSEAEDQPTCWSCAPHHLSVGSPPQAVERRASGGGGATTTTPPALTQAVLSTILAQGVETQQAPSNLTPVISQAKHDVSLAWKLGCLLGHTATSTSHRCIFGDTTSHKKVVLMGDSHAAAWFSGLELVARQQHWRLVFMGKIGCPFEDVLVKRNDGVWYHSCVAWRHDMEKRIAKLHPNLLVLTSSDYVGRAQPDTGKHNNNHTETWLDGVQKSFKALRHAADHVAFIANVPRLMQPADQCVAAHMSDVFPCTVAASQAFQYPQARRREMQLARANGVTPVDPAPWFCTPKRCPVIADDILIYRDSQHITPQWSDFLSPLLADALVPLITPAAGSA